LLRLHCRLLPRLLLLLLLLLLWGGYRCRLR
jgi:hypothetical protein